MEKLTKEQVGIIKDQIEESVSCGNMYPNVARTLVDMLNKTINYNRCCKSDSELLPTKKDFISELEQYQEKYKTAHTEKVNNAYALGFRHCFHFINDRVKLK